MFQVVFHAQIEAEENRFDIDDVVHDITHKMIVRHPHVFADTKVNNSSDVIVNWDNIKKEEKHILSPADALRRVPPFMPAILRSQKVQGKALSKYGYGISDKNVAKEKIIASLSQLDNADENSLSDAVFAICSLAEMKGIDLEAAITKKTDDFINDFEKEHSCK